MIWLTDFLNLLPLWALFVLTWAIGVAQVEFGSYLAKIVLRRNPDKDPEGPLGALVGSLLAMLAFFLAFTFGMAATRFDTRKQLVLEEANAIGTTYLRADLLPPAQGAEVKRLLREYVDLRLSITKQNIDDVLRKSSVIHGQLWAQVKLLVPAEMDGELRSLFITSLNQTFDLHQSRITVSFQQRIPGTIWFALYMLSFLSMLAVGYQVGMSGVRRLWGTPIVAGAFALVITMIADLDRPGEGMMRVSQQPIADVRESMQNSP
jgi:hypothetical protein